MALVWGVICAECQVLAVESCPHCRTDLCEKHTARHDCEKLRSQEYAVAG